MMFLHAAIKLGRLLRMQVVFGNRVNMNYVNAFLDYATEQLAVVQQPPSRGGRSKLSDASRAS